MRTRVKAAAPRRALPIVVHLWVPAQDYGREHSVIFLEQILGAAPDVVVQIAHFAGGGSGYVDQAIAPFVEAIAAGDPRTRNVYFDVTSVADGRRSEDELQRLAARVREVGLDRILFGSDMAPPPAWQPWMTFRMSMPLTAGEFQRIAETLHHTCADLWHWPVELPANRPLQALEGARRLDEQGVDRGD